MIDKADEFHTLEETAHIEYQNPNIVPNDELLTIEDNTQPKEEPIFRCNNCKNHYKLSELDQRKIDFVANGKQGALPLDRVSLFCKKCVIFLGIFDLASLK